MRILNVVVAGCFCLSSLSPSVASAAEAPVKRKVDPEAAKKKAAEAKAAAEQAAADKLKAEAEAKVKAEADAVKLAAEKAASEKAEAENKKLEEEKAAAAAAKAAEPPKGAPTWTFMLAPDAQPEHVLLMQASLSKAVQANDKLHLVEADISALPADLQAALNDGCRIASCRTALLAALKVPQGLMVEMNSSGSSMVLTLFSAAGETLGRSDGSCIACLEDEPKRDLVIGEMVQDLYLKPEPKTATVRASGPDGKGPLMRGQQRRKAPKARKVETLAWSPSVWTYAGAGSLAATGTTFLILASGAHSSYVEAINEERGPGEIQGIADAGKTRETFGYTSLLLSVGVVVASYVLEQEVKR
jgi:hypothetical protein